MNPVTQALSFYDAQAGRIARGRLQAEGKTRPIEADRGRNMVKDCRFEFSSAKKADGGENDLCQLDGVVERSKTDRYGYTSRSRETIVGTTQNGLYTSEYEIECDGHKTQNDQTTVRFANGGLDMVSLVQVQPEAPDSGVMVTLYHVNRDPSASFEQGWFFSAAGRECLVR